MSNIPFHEKITKLKKMHATSQPEAMDQLDSWEIRYAILKGQKEWLEHPNTKALKQLAEEHIALINGILSDREDITDVQRAAMFAQKKAHMVYLATLTENPDSEMKSIESSVDVELN